MTIPNPPVQQTPWIRHFFYRKESWRTTWKFRLGVLVLAVGAVVLSKDLWTASLAESLVCTENAPPSDALLLENFDPDYLVFEHAEALRRSGIASRVLVPLAGSSSQPNAVQVGTVELMARIAWLPKFETIPVEIVEPISLNAAYQVRDFLQREKIRSVIVVAPGFRSRRSALIYGRVLSPRGISVGCSPVFGTQTPRNWTGNSHAIQGVMEQFLKLQYYRLYVLPGLRADGTGSP